MKFAALIALKLVSLNYNPANHFINPYVMIMGGDSRVHLYGVELQEKAIYDMILGSCTE